MEIHIIQIQSQHLKWHYDTSLVQININVDKQNLIMNKKILIISVIILIVLILALTTIFKAPEKANYDDEIFIQIGGDDFLNVTLKGCVIVSEKDIDDGYVMSALNTNVSWFDAKNISYVDTMGRHGYMIIWKTSPDHYNIDTSENVNLYDSSYITEGMDAKSFVEYGWEEGYVYGIILDTSEISYSESDLIYKVLGLNRNGFDLTYSNTQSSTSYTSTSSHYGGVDDSPSKIATRDPDWYYDHYEYGDNPDIDDYLESEGYD